MPLGHVDNRLMIDLRGSQRRLHEPTEARRHTRRNSQDPSRFADSFCALGDVNRSPGRELLYFPSTNSVPNREHRVRRYRFISSPSDA